MKKIMLLFTIIFSSISFSQNWVYYNTINSRLPNNTINTTVIDESGMKWIGTQIGGLIFFDGTNWKIYNKSNSGLPDNDVQAIAIDKDGVKWIGTNKGGLVRYDGVNWTVFNKSNSMIPDNSVRAIAIDAQGNKWVGTYAGGLAKFNGSSWFIYNLANSGMPSDCVLSLAIDSKGVKWVGTNGGGLAKYDDVKWVVYNRTNSGTHCNTFLGIAIDKQGNKWFATYNGALEMFDDNDWWIYNEYNTPIKDKWIHAVAVDLQDVKWAGSNKKGLFRYTGTTWHYDSTYWTVYDTTKGNFPDTCILSIAVDRYNNKWIGTNSAGIAVFNESGLKIVGINVTAPEGGKVWAAGSKQVVSWFTKSVAGNINIKLSTDGGKSYPYTLSSNISNDGDEVVTLPTVYSASCRIKIESVSDTTVYGINPGNFILSPLPEVPLQISPANNSKSVELSPRITWKGNQYTQSFHLLVAEDAQFQKVLREEAALTDTVIKLQSLKEGKKYFWKISAKNAAGESAYSGSWNYTTLLNSPDSLSAQVLSRTKLKLTWNDKSNGESGYLIERGQNGNFLLIDSAKSNITSYTDTTVQIQIPYQYRVRAYTADALSVYSNVVTVTVTSVRNSTIGPKEYELMQNYPNPFNPSTVLRYSMPEESNVTLSIYNTLGEKVKEVVNSRQDAGYFEVKFDAAGLSSGIYYYRFEARATQGTGYYMKVRKMILIK